MIPSPAGRVGSALKVCGFCDVAIVGEDGYPCGVEGCGAVLCRPACYLKHLDGVHNAPPAAHVKPEKQK